MCRNGGIGRRKGLKIPRWKHRIGSTPIFGTMKTSQHSEVFYLLKSGSYHFGHAIGLCSQQSLSNAPTFFGTMKPYREVRFYLYKKGASLQFHGYLCHFA